MEFTKTVLMNLSTGQQGRQRHREQTCGCSWGRRGWDESREQHGNIYHHMQNRSRVGICCVTQELNSVLRDYPEGWDGEGDGRGVEEGGDICISGADSC